jgi:hypothetical protein
VSTAPLIIVFGGESTPTASLPERFYAQVPAYAPVGTLRAQCWRCGAWYNPASVPVNAKKCGSCWTYMTGLSVSHRG